MVSCPIPSLHTSSSTLDGYVLLSFSHKNSVLINELLTNFNVQNLGGSQMAMLMDFYLPRTRANRLTFSQRILGISTGLKAIFTPTFALLLLIVDALSLAFGLPATSITDKQTLILVLRLQCVSILIGWLYKLHMGLFVGYQFCTKELGSVTYMDPCKFTTSNFLPFVFHMK